MRTINLIPANYKGDPRDALGYNWETLVMDGCSVDKNKSVPGEDLCISIDECLAMLEAEHGTIASRDNGSYGWLSNEAKTCDGKTVNIDGLTPVANINCMWCGGAYVTVYAVVDAQTTANAETIEPMMITDVEATAYDEIIESIDDNANDSNFGYCKKCHTYCYGDCDANQQQ
jgi:hypothetical protein